jgi:hypothetical protein
VECVFGRRFSSRRRCTWTSVEARSVSFLIFLMSAALRRASNATVAAATMGIWGESGSAAAFSSAIVADYDDAPGRWRGVWEKGVFEASMINWAGEV